MLGGAQLATLALLHLLAHKKKHPSSTVCFLPQCHPARDGQRGKCWCVDQKTGMRLPGPLEPRGDLDCHQLTSPALRDWARRRGRETPDQLNSTGASLWNRMRRGLCPRGGFAPHGENTWTGVTTATPRFEEVLLASLFPPVRGWEVFGALLCVCQVNTLFRCFDVTDRKSLFLCSLCYRAEGDIFL